MKSRNNKNSLDEFDKYIETIISKHNDVEIPDELSIVVEKAINEGEVLRNKKKHGLFFIKVSKFALICLLIVVCMLNISPAFAKTMKEIPVAGEIFNFFTFREYHYEDEIKYVDIKVPEFVNTGKSKLEKKVNKEIKYYVNKEVEDSEKIIKEYYDAFISTGGKEEDFHPVELTVDYAIYQMNNEVVSFSISKYDNTFNAYNTKNFYNIDMKSGDYLTIKDYLGDDYKEEAVNAINKEIESWTDERKDLLWKDLNIYDLIDENTKFYIDENMNAVIVFEKYEIAVGAAGEIEFTIPFNNSSDK